MSEKEERYWNSLDTPLLSHTKSCLCSECKIMRLKRNHKIREKTAEEEAQARKKLFEQLESLGVPISQKAAQMSSETPKSKEKEVYIKTNDDTNDNRSLIEVESRRKIEAQLKSLGL